MAHKAVDTDTQNKRAFTDTQNTVFSIKIFKAAFISTGLPADSAQYIHQGLKN